MSVEPMILIFLDTPFASSAAMDPITDAKKEGATPHTTIFASGKKYFINGYCSSNVFSSGNFPGALLLIPTPDVILSTSSLSTSISPKGVSTAPWVKINGSDCLCICAPKRIMVSTVSSDARFDMTLHAMEPE